MPGLEQVYLRQAGTGSAALLGGSSWDPVQFAKYSAGLKAQQEAAKQAKKDKQRDQIFKDLNIKPGKMIESDRYGMNSIYDDFINLKAQTLLQDQRDLNPQDIQELYTIKSDIEKLDASHDQQLKNANSYGALIKNSQGKLDTEAMGENLAKYSAPDQFMEDDPEIAESFTPYLEYYQNDPIYKNFPDKALIMARDQWRNEQGSKYVTEPILNDVSLMEDYKDNVLKLVSENKQHVGKTLADGTYITEDYAYKVPYDTEVKTKDGEIITLKGTRSAAELRYDDSPIVQKSANNRFKKLDDTTKEDYVDKYGDDAAKQWYVDTYSPFGTEFSSTKTSRRTDKNSYNFNGQNYESPYDILKFTDKANIQWDRDPKKNVGGMASINGFTITQGKGANKKSYTMSGVTPNVIFRQSNGAQVPVEGGYTMDLEDAKIEQIATTNGLTWDIMKKSKTYDGKNVYDEFMNKWGKQYIKDFGNKGKNGDLAVKDISNIILTDDIADFLSKNGLGEYIEDKTYMTGQAKFYKPGNKTDVQIHYSDAVIPVDGTIESKLQTDLELPLNQIVKREFPPRDWRKGLKTRTNTNTNTNTYNPNQEVIDNTQGKRKSLD